MYSFDFYCCNRCSESLLSSVAKSKYNYISHGHPLVVKYMYCSIGVWVIIILVAVQSSLANTHAHTHFLQTDSCVMCLAGTCQTWRKSVPVPTSTTSSPWRRSTSNRSSSFFFISLALSFMWKLIGMLNNCIHIASICICMR